MQGSRKNIPLLISQTFSVIFELEKNILKKSEKTDAQKKMFY